MKGGLDVSRKKKAVPGVGSTEDGRTEQSALTGTTFSVSDFTTKAGPISSILMTGQGNALTGREIRRILHLKDAREVTALVERERHSGVPICASCDGNRPGYYLPETPAELREYIKRLRGRIKATTVTLEALEAVLEKWKAVLE